ncbi:hypothetical protein H8958_005184 [Nasalis larvatus]
MVKGVGGNEEMHYDAIPLGSCCLPSNVANTDRALSLLEEYCKKLRRPEEQLLKNAVKKVMGIFKSSLFQALLDCKEH